jgi:Centromere DNA-binding protein complex CBF3 subunit, domain 2
VELVAKQEVVKNNINFEDRGRNTLAATVTLEDFRRIAKYYWNLNTVYGLRHRADDLLRYALMTRGQVTRRLMFSRIGVRELDSGVQENTFALFAQFNESKTNQYGHQEQAGCMRHKEVDLCPIGALALYLFARFHIMNEEWPQMQSRDLWYADPSILVMLCCFLNSLS